jgi:hypothetical protein
MTRLWENAVTGMGAYVPGAVLFLVGAPMLAYFALWVRSALRAQRRENRRRMSQTARQQGPATVQRGLATVIAHAAFSRIGRRIL